MKERAPPGFALWERLGGRRHHLDFGAHFVSATGRAR